MELSKAHEIKVSANSTRWLLWVDDEIWGYTSTLDDAQQSRDNLSQEIKRVIQEEHPQWIIECLNTEEKVVKIKCLHPGWVYNSKWTAHTVRYEPVNKFNLLMEPIDLSTLIKCVPSIDAIQKQEETAHPDTRPPTPRPEEKSPLVLEEVPVPPPIALMSDNRPKKFKKNRKKSKSKQAQIIL